MIILSRDNSTSMNEAKSGKAEIEILRGLEADELPLSEVGDEDAGVPTPDNLKNIAKLLDCKTKDVVSLLEDEFRGRNIHAILSKDNFIKRIKYTDVMPEVGLEEFDECHSNLYTTPEGDNILLVDHDGYLSIFFDKKYLK